MAGIRETVLMGLLGLHMEGRKLTASGLAGLSLFDFSRAFSLPLTVEKEVMPGVRQDVPAPHRPLVEAMHRTLQDGCRILGERNFTRWSHSCSETASVTQSFFQFWSVSLFGCFNSCTKLFIN